MTTPCGPALTAVTAGQTYDLNDGVEISLLAYDLSLASLRRLSQRSPLQIGDTDLGFRVEPRFEDLAWVIKGTTLEDYRNVRGRFLETWVGRDTAVQLIFAFTDRTRALDVHLDGELNMGERMGLVERISGVFKASDPRLYDPTAITLSFSLAGAGGGGAGGWEIDWPIPWAIGTDTLDHVITFLYANGSRLAAPEYPRIRIFGPIDSPVVTNETTEEVIDLSANGGLSLSGPTEWVDIDLAGPDRRDAKTIRDQDGDSADQYLTSESDLATWHLAPAGEQLPDGSWATGSNTVRVQGSGVTSQSLATMTYYDRYWAT